MFALSEKTATVTHVNARTEKHGDDDVLAVDVSFSVTMSAADLAMFDPELPGVFYLPPDDAQETIDGVPNVSTRLRCKLLKPAALDLKLEGRDVVLDRATSAVNLPTSKIANFVILAREGGSVTLTFVVKCNTDVDGSLGGELLDLLQDDVDLTIEVGKPAEGDPQVGANGAATKTNPDGDLLSKDAGGATDAFIAAHGEKASS